MQTCPERRENVGKGKLLSEWLALRGDFCPKNNLAISLGLACSFAAGIGQLNAQNFDHARICDAIEGQTQIRLFYRPGEPERIVEPRYLYYTKNRNVVLNGRQVAGYSASGNLPGPRSFRLDRAQRIEFTQQAAASGQGSGQLPSGVAEVICRK